MGAAFSSPAKAFGVGGKIHESFSRDSDDPPHKRRRIGSIAGPAAASGVAVAATDRDHSLVDQLFVAHEVSSVQRTLRIDVLKIVHKDLSNVRVSDSLSDVAAEPRNVQETRARCKVMLTYAGKAGDVVLHCQSQICTVKSFSNPFPMARIYLRRSFYIPEESILVNRSDNNPPGLGDSYKVTVELEDVGSGGWPPLESVCPSPNGQRPEGPELSSRDWVLGGDLTDVFSRRRSMMHLKLMRGASKPLPTDYLIDVHVRWSTGFEAGAFRPLENGVEPSITVEGPPSSPSARRTGEQTMALPQAPPSNGLANGAVNKHAGGHGHGEEEPEEELTPSRSLRTRETKNYNLKLLSDKAHGKDRTRRKRKASTDAGNAEPGRISYDLPAEQVHLTNFRCVTCGQIQSSLLQLQIHFQFQHPEYTYIPRSTNKGTHIQVLPFRESFASDPATRQVDYLMRDADLGKTVAGSDYWGRGRRGDGDEYGGRNQKKRATSLGSPVKAAKIPPSGKATILVPHTKQPLFDPVSRLPLEPGTEFRRPSHDDAWLIQWHREAIEDFSDIPHHEREFLTTWDEFMLTQRISSEVYLPSAWLRFVRLKANWLVSSDPRMMEFGKHLSYLVTRGTLNDKTIQEALHILRKAKEAKRGQETNGTALTESAPKEAKTHFGAAGCGVCKQQVLGPTLLVCANTDCAHRVFHRDCATKEANQDVNKIDWCCNECARLPAKDQT